MNLNKTYDTSGKILPTPLSQEHAQTSENPLTKIPTQVPEVYVMSISSNIEKSPLDLEKRTKIRYVKNFR